MKQASKQDIVQELRSRILAMQGKGKSGNESYSIGLGNIEAAFSGGVFPRDVIHEFTSLEPESAASTSGFLSCLLHSLSNSKGFCLWVSSRRIVFPPALELLGVDPEHVIFVDLKTDKDVLWVVEEGLRCSALVAVVGELRELTFTQSRRLQLAIGESPVTGFIHRMQPQIGNATASAVRWKVSPLPGVVESGLPGIGFPKWRVELEKVRNGRVGSWELAWTPTGFEYFSKTRSEADNKTGEAQYA